MTGKYDEYDEYDAYDEYMSNALLINNIVCTGISPNVDTIIIYYDSITIPGIVYLTNCSVLCFFCSLNSTLNK